MKNFNFYLESVTSSGFRLAKGLDPSNYKITSRLSDWTRLSSSPWKARVLVGNNGGEIGKFTAVGYIAVNLKSNEIIPISVNDEHRAGYEILYDMQREFKINPADWYNISTSNYIYDEEEEKLALDYFKQWERIGGNTDFKVIRTNVPSEMEYKCTIAEFIKYDGKPPVYHETVESDAVNKIGMNLIKIFERIALYFREYHRTGNISNKAFDLILDLKKWDDDLRIDSPLFELSYKYLNNTSQAMSYNEFKKIYGDDFKSIVMRAMHDNDIEGLEDLIFGMNGLKNIYHAGLKFALKEFESDPKDFYRSYRNTIFCFGSIKAAIREFDRISGI